MTAVGVWFRVAPDVLQSGDHAVVGTAMLGGAPAIAAFGAGTVRRTNGRFGGRGWTVVGFLLLAITSVAVSASSPPG
jgi:hypothetical protein